MITQKVTNTEQLKFAKVKAWKYFPLAAALLLLSLAANSNSSMTVTGPIAAGGVTVTGDVTMSSVTVSSLTITNLLNVNGKAIGLRGDILQMRFSSSTTTVNLTSATFQPIDSMKVSSFTLSNPNDYVRITLTGILSFTDSGGAAYVTIKRDNTDLGNTSDNSGLSACTGTSGAGYNLHTPVGITVKDSPGDRLPHTYQAYMRYQGTVNPVAFIDGGVGYLLLEEIRQ